MAHQFLFTVTTTPTPVLNQSTCQGVSVQGRNATADIYLGANAQLTTANGHVLRAGQNDSWDDTDFPVIVPWLCTASGTDVVSVIVK